MNSGPGDFSFARHALLVLGSAAAVLMLTAFVVVLLRPSGGVGLLVVGVGVVTTLAVASAAAKRSMRRSFGDGSDADHSVDPTDR